MRVQWHSLGELTGAQPSSVSGRPRPVEAAATTSSISEIRPRTQQVRARRILAAGAGLFLSAAVTPVYVLPYREPCWGSDQSKGSGPLKIAAGVGTVGFAAAVGGVIWLVRDSRRHGYYASNRERRIAGALGALTFVLSQGLLGGAFVVDQICHN